MNYKKLFKNILKTLFILMALIVTLFYFNMTPDIPVERLKEKYADQYSQFMDIDGLEVHYKDEGSGIPIVLIHGTSASLHTWDDWTKRLTDQYRVIRMDLPAFGITGPNAKNDYRIETYVDFLDQFLARLKVDSIYLAGNSLGGEIAWNYTADYPEKVKKLILVDAAGYVSERAVPMVFKLARTPILNSFISHITPRSFIEKNLKEVYFDDSKITNELIDRYYEFTLREGSRSAFISRAKLSKKDNTDRLKKITTPTLILWGKEDMWTPLSFAHQFHADLPNSELAIMEETGHIPMEERPSESLDLVLEFIEK